MLYQEAPKIKVNSLGKLRRRVLTLAVAVPVINLLIGGMTFILLWYRADSGLASRLNQPNPLMWLPFASLGILSLAYAILCFFQFTSLEKAVPYQLTRATGVLFLGSAFSIYSFSLLKAALVNTSFALMMLSFTLALLFLSLRFRIHKKQIEDAKQNNGLSDELSLQNGTWSGKLYSQIQSKIKNESETKVPVLLQHLHWLAPAFGILLARGASNETLFFILGSIFMILGVLTLDLFIKDFALAQRVRAWSNEIEGDLRLG